MFTTRYVELHARSAFSFLEGASLPEALASTAAELGLPAMALLDSNGVYGCPRFHVAAKKVGIDAHVGAEVNIAEVPSPDAPSLPLLVKSRGGYQNLCQLITKTKLRVNKNSPSAATLSELQTHAQGLICLTGDENGILAKALAQGGIGEARTALEQLVSIFGKENVYIELQRHFHRQQEWRNQTAISLACELKVPLLATNGVCYASPQERLIADAFTCIKNKRKLDDAGRLLCRNSERYLRTPTQMANIFADIPQALANTEEVSSRLKFTLENLGYQFPAYPVPEGETMASFLRKRTFEGACQRYQPFHSRVRRQLDCELALIEKLGFAGYFLIVWDIVRYCRENNIMAQGRGSAANSAVCFALGITAVDPIRMGLLFERFLSEERGRTEWPDIDIDLPSGDRREKVIQHVYESYGRRGAAMTANVITYRGKSAAREMGKVLGFEEETLNKLSALVSSWEWKGPEDTFQNQFKQAGFDLDNSRMAQFLDLTLRIQDLPRHLGQHSGGMVICQNQLDSVVPLEPATMPGRVVLQWDKEDCADLSLVKVDLLGLGMMAVLEDSVSLIGEHYAEEIDLGKLPQDPQVYKVISAADTVGMFQIESRAQMASLPRNHPTEFYDLVVQVALIRPGPIVGRMTNPYLKRRQGKEDITYPHKSLKPILERTLGVPLFQEQLLRMAMVCAGFSGGEAEELRRALGSKRSEQRMKEIGVKLRAGMTANGIKPAVQDEIVQFITSFALYGFPESHAASFALLAYASAYLKVHYLPAFLAALLNNQPMGFYAPDTLVNDAKRKKVQIRPIDITCSATICTLEVKQENYAVRLGLNYVKGLKQSTAEQIVRERSQAPFSSVKNLCNRVPQISQNEIESLSHAGALFRIQGEKTKLHRRAALWQGYKAFWQVGPLLKELLEEEEICPLQPMTPEEQLIADYQTMGLTLGPHPLFFRRKELQQLGTIPANALSSLQDGEKVKIAGCVIVRQRPGTAHGFIFLSMEDHTGIANVIITPDIYEKNRLMVLRERFLLIAGRLQNKENVVHVKAELIAPLHFEEMETRSHDFH